MLDALIAHRYRPISLLGRGGGGVVWRARDERGGGEVALKLIQRPDEAARQRLRRELAALRWLRMPGVAEMRDEGPHGADWFIALELVEGPPFPGLPGRLGWEELRGPALALLRVLARVHAAGVVHRDLKPANVLLRAGQPVLLDFGVSRGHALAPGGAAREYTPQFAAPEQLRGEREDARTDLFAVGRMLQLSLDPDRAPPEVQALLRRMLATRRARRPTAAEALASLEDAPPLLPMLAQSPEELRPLFLGHELFHHLPEDAAALLFARAGSDPEAAARELRRWVDLGFVRELDGRYLPDRVGLERLADEASDAVLVKDLLRGRSPARLTRTLRALARERAAAGQHERATAALDLALSVAGGSEPLFADWTRLALARESLSAIDRALYTLERAKSPPFALLQLLRGAAAAFRGEGARARALLEELGPLDDEELETFRQGHRLRAASRQGLAEEEALLEELRVRAEGSPARQLRLEGWLGNLRYRQNRFAEAAALHRGRSERTPEPHRRLSARLDAAMALLEVPALDEAAALARGCAAEAAAARHAVYEGYATAYLRIAEYRAGRADAARPELVEAALPLRAHLAALLAVTEAAVAWRAGQLPLARSLARQAEAHFRSLGHEEPSKVSAALAFAAGDAEDPGRLLQPTWRLSNAGVQVLGLLALGGAFDPSWPALARQWATTRPPEQWGARLDVLSFDEALAALDQKATRL